MTRQPGKLTMRVEGAGYLFALECPTEGRMTTVVVTCLATAFDELEAFLASGKANWTQTYAERKKNLSRLDKGV